VCDRLYVQTCPLPFFHPQRSGTRQQNIFAYHSGRQATASTPSASPGLAKEGPEPSSSVPRSKANLALPPRERLPQPPDGEAAKLEEARQQAEPEDGTDAWGTVVLPTITRSAALA
jgi:hypothetical protein